ncbi:hypothetical protein M569_02565 [Genlisea aurea]|uniref:Uncharacterized protein n=1 Tax=Genlisea aurea TaxID=192259 RepID=S8CXJ7_9LAMI|nr:hypothetical protein M569_02565 [Genlisea aurea]
MRVQIQLVLGRDSSIGVGWRTKQEKVSASGEVMIGTSSLGATASCKYRFSANSHGRIAGTFGSGGIAFQIGGGRRISKYSSFRMLYCIGAQGLIWKFELIRGGQKLVLPLLLSNYVSPAFATGAFFIPLSIYLTVKKFVAKPYYLRREKKASLENIEKTKRQVEESMTRAEKAQQLLKNVAERKKNKQLETGGLVVLKAVYATPKSLSNLDKPEDAAAFRILDVTIPLNFLVTDAGQLKLHEGVKKSGIMGFCDPSPGEPKQLLVEYAYGGNKYEVRVDDFGELLIPQDKHRV